MLADLRDQADHGGQLGGDSHCADSIIVRAYQHTVGVQKAWYVFS
jgi:hypothetical protein